jgi:hypothetical protein
MYATNNKQILCYRHAFVYTIFFSTIFTLLAATCAMETLFDELISKYILVKISKTFCYMYHILPFFCHFYGGWNDISKAKLLGPKIF